MRAERGESPRVSVVIPTRDRTKGLLRLLLALRSQTLDPARFEAIVVDDGTRGGAAAVLAMAREGARFPIRAVRLSGKGPAAARNAGIALARAPLVAFVDDDCEPEPEWLEALLGRAKDDEPTLGAVAGRVVAAPSRTFAGRYAAAARLLDDPRVERGEDGVFPVTANALVPSAVLADAGGFDERFLAAGGEETDLFARIRERGLRFRSAPGAVVRHHFPDRLATIVGSAFRYGMGNGLLLRRAGKLGRALTCALGALALHRLPLGAIRFAREGASLADAVRFAIADGARRTSFKAGVLAGALFGGRGNGGKSAAVAGAETAFRPHSLFAEQDLVVVSNQCRFEGPTQPVHQFVKRLREGHRVLFVEGNYSLGKMALALLGRPFAFAPFGRFRVDRAGRFFVLTPPPRLPFRHVFRLVGRVQQAMLRAAIRRACRRAGFESPILWTFLHQSAGLVGSLGERLAIYHCVDPWGELIPAARLGRREVVLEDERDLARRVDVVVATAAALRNDLLPHNRASHYVPNAVDADAVLGAIRKLDPARDDDPLANYPRPRIGFVGAPERKLDADLLAEVARIAPDLSFVIVGPLRNFPGRRRLERLPNVALIGAVPASQVPAHVLAVDVAIIPFRVDSLTRGVSPLKLFEYLAAGKPVVSTPIPEVADYRDVVRTASDAAGFASAIREALEEAEDPEKLRLRVEAAQQNTWNHRVADVARLLETKLRTTAPPGPGPRDAAERSRERLLR